MVERQDHMTAVCLAILAIRAPRGKIALLKDYGDVLLLTQE